MNPSWMLLLVLAMQGVTDDVLFPASGIWSTYVVNRGARQQAIASQTSTDRKASAMFTCFVGDPGSLHFRMATKTDTAAPSGSMLVSIGPSLKTLGWYFAKDHVGTDDGESVRRIAAELARTPKLMRVSAIPQDRGAVIAYFDFKGGQAAITQLFARCKIPLPPELAGAAAP